MCLVCSVGYMTTGAVVALSASSTSVLKTADIDPAAYSDMRATVSQVSLPVIEQPQWLKDQLAAEAAAAQAVAGAKRAASTLTVTYDVSTRGVVTASLSEFKLQVNQTLNDARGWARMNVKFVEVASGGRFSMVLSEASQLPTFSSGCSADYSCRVGRYVVINQDRWMGATPSWNNAGGSLRDYRHMVVNHETGHWLGRGHVGCPGSGPAPVMMQQSKGTGPCTFNPWPLPRER